MSIESTEKDVDEFDKKVMEHAERIQRWCEFDPTTAMAAMAVAMGRLLRRTAVLQGAPVAKALAKDLVYVICCEMERNPQGPLPEGQPHEPG